jgi:hypothetical protein
VLVDEDVQLSSDGDLEPGALREQDSVSGTERDRHADTFGGQSSGADGDDVTDPRDVLGGRGKPEPSDGALLDRERLDQGEIVDRTCGAFLDLSAAYAVQCHRHVSHSWCSANHRVVRMIAPMMSSFGAQPDRASLVPLMA